MPEGSNPLFVNIRTNQPMSIPDAILATDVEEMVDALSTIFVYTESITYNVGTSGDFTTLNEALEFVTKKYAAYNATTPVTVELHLLTGYTQTEEIEIQGLDLRFITITAADNPVPVTVTGDLFTFNDCSAPIIACIFDMGSTGGHGVFAAHSYVVFSAGGIRHAGSDALHIIADNHVVLLDSFFDHAQGFGAYIDHQSTVHFGDTDMSFAGQAGGNSPLGTPWNGVHLRHSSYANVSGVCDFRLDGATDDVDDFQIQFGGIADVTSEYLGGKSQPANLISRRGIFFNSDDEEGNSQIASGSMPAANVLNITDIPEWVSRLSIKLDNVSIDTAARHPLIQISLDNGSSYITTGYYTNARVINGGGGFDDVITDAIIAPNDDLAAARSYDVVGTLWGINDGEYPCSNFYGVADDNSSRTVCAIGFYPLSTARITAIRVIVNGSGNFDGGTYDIRALP